MSNASREPEYDLFVSYARADNEGHNAGKVSALVRAIAERYERDHETVPRVFFDVQPAPDAGELEESVLRTLDQSAVLLAILSPAYFQSPWCKREWERHLECCRQNNLQDVPVVAVAIDEATVPGWLSFPSQTAVVKCQNWWHQWPPPLAGEPEEIDQAIRQIADAVFDCLNRISARLTPLTPADERRHRFPLDRVRKPRCQIEYELIDEAAAANDSDADEPVLDRPTACGEPDVAEAAAQKPAEPIEISENVQFTLFRPRAVPPSQWRTLLAFAHLAELPPDADLNDPDPLEEVERQAQQSLGPDFQAYGKTTQDSTSAVPRQGLIVFIPEMEGITFNPPRYEFQWVENVHKAEFRLRAAPQLEGKTARGRLTVFLGSLILAEIPLQFRVDSRAAATDSSPDERATARPYRNIFASYSHADMAIVRQFEEHAKALGDRYLRDVVDLRAGQVWNDELMRLIEEANVFQLFWSHNAMQSQFVRQEWEYALSLRRPDFIRPTYWETPFPELPQAGLPPEHLRRIHFHFIGTERQKDVRSDAAMAIPSAIPSALPEQSVAASPGPITRSRDLPPARPAPARQSSLPRSRRPRAVIWLGAATMLTLLVAVGLFNFTGPNEHRTASAPPAFPVPPQPDLPGPQPKFELSPDMSDAPAPPGGPIALPDDLHAQRDLSTSLEGSADRALRGGDVADAERYLQRDLQIWQNPAFQAPPEGIPQLSEALRQGETFLQQGKMDEARQSFQKYLETASRLAKSLPAEARPPTPPPPP